MKNKYKIPWHVRQYVKKELMDYISNKKLVAKYKGDTRGLILANMRLTQIENVLNSSLTVDGKLQKLINKANNRGGTDNISVAYLKKEDSE